MKCQRCEKPATFHITELASDTPDELHLCEEHARLYLTQADEPEDAIAKLGGSLKEVKIGQTAEDLARLDQQACPVCGITFYEFRHVGRLGCPHDYVCFEEELEPLITNIHGAKRHTGKHPTAGENCTDARTELIQLRREMQVAIDQEDYELASRLRDQIQVLNE